MVSSPNRGSNDNELYAVAATGPGDVWAVGLDSDDSAFYALMEHWNGSSWSVVASPSPSASDNELHAVAAGRTMPGSSASTTTAAVSRP